MLRTLRVLTLAAAVFAAAPARADVYLGTYYDNTNSRNGGEILKFPAATPTSPVTVAPAGAVTYDSGLTFGRDGFLYAATQSPGTPGTLQNQIVRINPTTGAASTFINLTPISASYNPGGLRFGPDGNLYVAQFGNFGVPGGTIDRFTMSYTGTVPTPTGARTSIATNLSNPGSIAFGSDNNLYVSDYLGGTAGGAIIKVTNPTGASPTTSTFIDSPTGGLQDPTGLTFGPDGNLYVVDQTGSAVRRYSPTGSALGDLIASTSSLNGQFPNDLTFDGSTVWVSTLGGNQGGPANPTNQPLGAVYRFQFNGAGSAATQLGTGPVVSNLWAANWALQPVPEPGTLALAGGAALAGLAAWRRRRPTTRA